MSKFVEGQEVKFIDKFGIEQEGTFKEYVSLPSILGTTRTCIVMARPFSDMGDDMIVQCAVPEDSLTLVEMMS